MHPKPTVVDRALLEHLAELARLTLSPEREAVLRRKLQELVTAFTALADAPLDPAPAPGASEGVRLRPDRAEPTPDRDVVLANAPRTADGCFVVPRVVDA